MTETPSVPSSELAASYLEIMLQLLERRELSSNQIKTILQGVLSGQLGDIESAAILTALRMKGESADDLEAAARLLRDSMVPLPLESTDVLDTCGTGGDGANTFNISTATALVVAGTGVRVVKHGNRAASSCSGSADALHLLGVRLVASPSLARKCLEEAGLAFCFAPYFHPAMKRIADTRRRLGFRTLFNCMGPLLNPARAAFQLLGIGQAQLMAPMSEALRRLGTRGAFLVRSEDGLDEVSLSAPTRVFVVRNDEITLAEWTPRDFGLPRCSLSDLRATSPAESIARMREVLEGREGPALHVVLANAAAALLLLDRAKDLKEGVALAHEAVRKGQALRVLERLRMLTHESDEP